MDFVDWDPLGWDFVLHATKVVILSELTNRTASDVDACAMVNSPVFPCFAQMLWSPNAEAQSASCLLLGNLMSHSECTALAILELEPCERLVSLMG